MIKMLSSSSFVLALALSTSLSYAHPGNSSEDNGSYPSRYAVYQQQGPTCPHISWFNLQKVRAMRERGEGHIVFQEDDFVTKAHSYAKFFPAIRSIDRIYETLRASNGSYASYEQTLRTEGIKSTGRYDSKGNFVDSIDWLPTNKARREAYSPYNIKVDLNSSQILRWLPILQNPDDGQLHYYSYLSGLTYPLLKVDGVETEEDVPTCRLYTFDWDNTDNSQYNEYVLPEKMLSEMNISASEVSEYIAYGKDFLGSSNVYYLKASSDHTFQQESFYEVGSYQHMLFACGLDSQNNPFDVEDNSLEARASFELRDALLEEESNPWSQINPEDLFEYHLTEIFKSNEDLKQRAVEAVNFFNNPWSFYQESFDLFDSAGDGRTKLSTKQRFMPGEDQMLAYYLSGQLRFLSASTISMDALISVEELEDELGESVLKAMKAFQKLPGVPSHTKVVRAAQKKKYGSGNGKYSFLDVWTDIKAVFQEQVIEPLGKRDFASFYGHGMVISFDDELINQQQHEFPEIALDLGFETWDSTYDGLNPFYKRPGAPDDVINFNTNSDAN